ncbi:protein mono-ADP-ribosyltransferase PARP15-like [Dreissena polymorpha]|uniref:protein mono-ADP-ribosyltransferase PARP15-like n=1 Tax=Dreissena polymorpha TaxID=45954 RepID=UPI00226508EB|nr:protein mono-ADP-ribosyltransferase PARP15-like [Dreissena polymorpha]
MKDGSNVKRLPLQRTDPEFQRIEQRFLTELINGKYANSPGHKYDKSKTKVETIDKIQYKALCRQYLTKKKCLEESNPNRPANMPLERELWHGTNQNAMDSIILHGFKRSYAWDNIGKPWWGQGVYFAPDASYSARSWMTEADCYGSKGYVLLVKVLTGQFLKGNPYMRYLPPIDKNNPLVLYDCAVDEEPHGVCHL